MIRAGKDLNKKKLSKLRRKGSKSKAQLHPTPAKEHVRIGVMIDSRMMNCLYLNMILIRGFGSGGPGAIKSREEVGDSDEVLGGGAGKGEGEGT